MTDNIIEELTEKPKKKKKPQKDKPINVFGALFFITLGVVFLLNNFGILPWGIWSILWRFWPIFLIMAGLQILAGRSWIASLLVFGLGLGLISTVIIYSLSVTNSQIAEFIDQRLPIVHSLRKYIPTNPGNLITNTFIARTGEFENVKLVIIDMDLGAGRFSLTDTEEDMFMKVDADYYEDFGEPEITTERDGDTLVIKLRAKKDTIKFFGGVDEVRYDITLGNNDIPKNIFIRVGAGSLDAEFDNSEILNFNASLGAGKVDMKIEEMSLPHESMDLGVGAGSMNLQLPPATFARFEYAAGAGVLNIDGQRLRGAGDYTTTNFSITDDPLPIKVNIGAGTINIDL